MRFLIVLPAILLPAASTAAPPVIQVAPETQASADMPVINPGIETAAGCPPTSRYHATQRGRSPDAKKLNELPAADHYKAVYRRIGDCEVPIVAGYNIGGESANPGGR